MRTYHLLAQPFQLSLRLVDLRKGKTQLRQRQAYPPGYSLEVCTKLGQTLRMRLHKSAPASVGQRCGLADPVRIELAPKQAVDHLRACDAAAFGQPQQLSLRLAEAPGVGVDLCNKTRNPVLLQVQARNIRHGARQKLVKPSALAP